MCYSQCCIRYDQTHVIPFFCDLITDSPVSLPDRIEHAGLSDMFVKPNHPNTDDFHGNFTWDLLRARMPAGWTKPVVLQFYYGDAYCNTYADLEGFSKITFPVVLVGHFGDGICFFSFA
jgi:hypothetical protein